jgi:hypothetical protein
MSCRNDGGPGCVVLKCMACDSPVMSKGCGTERGTAHTNATLLLLPILREQGQETNSPLLSLISMYVASSFALSCAWICSGVTPELGPAGAASLSVGALIIFVTKSNWDGPSNAEQVLWVT